METLIAEIETVILEKNELDDWAEEKNQSNLHFLGILDNRFSKPRPKTILWTKTENHSNLE